MSLAHLENHIIEADITGGHQYPLQSPPTQAPQGVSNFVDGSGPIFSMYLEMAWEEDKKMTEGWKADADGILIFTGLFSAAVASLISVSIQDIRPNSQDTSNFYLANIYQVISDPNRPTMSPPPSPPSFSPPNYAVWVNMLWSLSLVISLTCALLATLLQQWARRYLKVTQPHYSPHKRARIRAFFAKGVEKLHLPLAVEALPTLLHISLFLFFAGLVVFLWNVNLTIFKLVLSWVGICATLYGYFTVIPIFCHDSPCYTPLSSLVWHTAIGTSCVFFRVLRWFTSFPYSSRGARSRFRFLEESYRKLLVQGMQKSAEETALNPPSNIDTRTFLWTFDSLDEDHELERFFSGLPGFRRSKVVDDPLPGLTGVEKQRLSETLMGFLDRTFSSDLLPGPVKNRRAIICAKAIDPAEFPHAYDRLLFRIVFQDQYRGLQTAESGRILRSWGNSGSERTALLAQATASHILARARRRDDSWFNLASDELGVPETVLRDYATNGHSLPLVILIHVTRQQLTHYGKKWWPGYQLSEILEANSQLDAQDTLTKLQHDFCALWNQIILKAQNDNDQQMTSEILGPIHNVYLALHQGIGSAQTGSPTLYPLCNIPGHHPNPTPDIHDNHASITSARTVLRDNAALVPSSTTSTDTPSSAHSSIIPTDVPPVDNNMSVSWSPAYQTAESHPILTNASLVPIPGTSTLAPPLSSASPPVPVGLQSYVDFLVPSDLPNLSSSAPNHVFDNIIRLSPLPSPQSPAAQFYLPTSLRSTIVSTTLSAFPELTSTPDLGAAAEDDGGSMPSLHNGEDALNPPSVNRAIHANTTDLPPQFLSLLSVTDPDAAITVPSLRGQNAGRTVDHPLDPSHSSHDMV